MCGIVGIASNSNSINALVEGLKKLAYRGYDSAGLATLVNNEIVKRVALRLRPHLLRPSLLGRKRRCKWRNMSKLIGENDLRQQ